MIRRTNQHRRDRRAVSRNQPGQVAAAVPTFSWAGADAIRVDFNMAVVAGELDWTVTSTEDGEQTLGPVTWEPAGATIEVSPGLTPGATVQVTIPQGSGPRTSQAGYTQPGVYNFSEGGQVVQPTAVGVTLGPDLFEGNTNGNSVDTGDSLTKELFADITWIAITTPDPVEISFEESDNEIAWTGVPGSSAEAITAPSDGNQVVNLHLTKQFVRGNASMGDGSEVKLSISILRNPTLT